MHFKIQIWEFSDNPIADAPTPIAKSTLLDDVISHIFTIIGLTHNWVENPVNHKKKKDTEDYKK